MASTKARVALFDLDRTLIDCNSAHLWVRHEWRAGRLSVRDVGYAAWSLLKYSMGSSDVEKLYLAAVGRLAGEEEEVLATRTQQWFDAEVRHRVRPGALASLEAHRQAGDTLVVCTSSSPYAGGAAKDAWGLDDLICTRFEAVDGVFTGRISSFALAHHKADRAVEWAAEHGVDLAEAAFYTDSFTDIALMERVGRPVAVNPDRPLRKAALARGWEVVDWGSAV